MDGDRWSFILYAAVLFSTVLVTLYTLLYYSYDGGLKGRDAELGAELRRGPLQSLVDGSGVNGIPRLNLVTNNAALATANRCGDGPVYIGASGTVGDCVRTCANSSARVIAVADGELFVYKSVALRKGAHCTIGRRPECDMRTSIALMTINSVICRSKFPGIVGGPLGTTVVACNNRLINDPQNRLWDYKTDVKFDPWTTTITDADERLPDGAFRFRCKFDGVDARGNAYQEHPFDRFHPISNYCASRIYRAHPDVKTTFNDDRSSFACDCGEFGKTRVTNVDPGDPRSPCSAVAKSVKTDVKNRMLMTLVYNCFTLYSTLEDVGRYLPCSNEQFTREGSQTGSVVVPYTETEDLIEHPMYADMGGAKVSIHESKTLVD